MKIITRIIILFSVVLSALSCSPSEGTLPPENVVPEFVELKYETGTLLEKIYVDLSARLSTVNGVTSYGFMIGRNETDLAYLSASLEENVISARITDLMPETEYCFYARAGNGRNEIRTRIVRFKTSAEGSSGTVPSPGEPENPDNPDQPVNPENPENPDQPVDPENPENPDQPVNPENPDRPDEPDDPGILPPPDGVGITVSDRNFLKYLLSRFDADADGKIVGDETKGVTGMSFCTDDINTLDGIQYFSDLKSLDCQGTVWNGQLSSLALQQNTSLEKLNCSYNRISSILLPSSLTELDCRFNKFQTVNFKNAVHLKKLNCYGCGIQELDLSSLTELEELSAGFNSFKTLDISSNKSLKFVDLEDSPDLEVLYVARGQRIMELYVDNSVETKYKE